MKTKFHNVLFENKDTALFKNQKELVDIILKNPSNILHSKKKASLTSLISKILREKRKAPKNIQIGILEAIQDVKSTESKKNICTEQIKILFQKEVKSPRECKMDFLHVKHEKNDISTAVNLLQKQNLDITLFNLNESLLFLKKIS